ncbi:MAG: hypothetical protein RBT11_17920 [Desulfobacterales bacterium]|nr:hypothetical protein [Desulfobacterales bacterium]
MTPLRIRISDATTAIQAATERVLALQGYNNDRSEPNLITDSVILSVRDFLTEAQRQLDEVERLVVGKEVDA